MNISEWTGKYTFNLKCCLYSCLVLIDSSLGRDQRPGSGDETDQVEHV